MVAYKAGETWIDQMQGKYDLPMIMYTPERIFSNEIPLFDINFFTPPDDTIVFTTNEGGAYVDESILEEIDYAQDAEVWKEFVESLVLSNFELLEHEYTTDQHINDTYGRWSGEDFKFASYTYYSVAYDAGLWEMARQEREDPDHVFNTTRHLRASECDLVQLQFWEYQGYIYMLQVYDRRSTVHI